MTFGLVFTEPDARGPEVRRIERALSSASNARRPSTIILFVSGAAVRTIFLPERYTAMPGEVFTTAIASVPLA
jgi:hypothetical protein